MSRNGHIKKKILLLLLAGVAIGFSGMSYKRHARILKETAKEWRDINRNALNRGINSLFESKLIEQRVGQNGTTSFILSANGKKTALMYNLENIEIPEQKNWDGKWRIVLFDVPEKYKKVREALRFHFKKLGFLELQKSVFVHPYPCEKEIKYIVEFYNAKSSVRFIVAQSIDNEKKFLKYFEL